MNDKDIWKDISEAFENFSGYLISPKGEVFSKKSNKIKTQHLSRGYWQIGLTNNSHKNVTVRTHRLVARLFCSGHEDGLVVNHIDGNKLNNDYRNLEWVTHEQNLSHAACNLLCDFGEFNRSAVLDWAKVLAIRTMSKHKLFSSRKLAAIYGVSYQSILSARKGTTWKHF
jgi:hypothetical protein